MSSTGVNGIGNLFAQGQTPVIGVGAVKQDKDVSENFGKIMNSASASAGNTLNFQVKSGKDSDGYSGMKTSADTGYEYQYRDYGIREGSQEPARDMEQIAEKLDTYAEDVKEVLKENLGVTDEEIENAMAALGLTMADIQNPAQLANLVAELTGCTDVGELLCNGNFLQIIQEVQALDTALEEELGISGEELQQLYETFTKQAVTSPDQEISGQENSKEPVATATGTEQTDVHEDSENMADVKSSVVAASTKNPEEGETVIEEGEGSDGAEGEYLQAQVKTNPNETSKDGSSDASEEGAEASYSATDEEVPEISEKKTTVVTEDKNFASQGQEENHAGAGNVVDQKLTDAIKANSTQPALSYAGQVDTADVIRQIVEATRVTVAQSETTMEMQLNPEHLGKIYLEVTSREGGITARIMAQDEAVKAALETQVAELKQSMEQTGIKVEAVEVTVGSHEFERNLEQNAQQQERQAEEQEMARRQTRKINLNDLDELNGIMTEEEMLVAQMMADAGNSVDYTA